MRENNRATATETTGVTFQINNAKGFKRTISWNKYRSEITPQTKNNNLDYVIDPTIRKINRSFVFHSKMVMMIQREILLMNVTCHL